MTARNEPRTIFLVPHTHYDVVWAMTKEDYLNIHKKLLRQALDLIRGGGFKFLVEQTYLLEQIESDDPGLFSEIHRAILDGDIEIADGEYLMPDPMIPAEEVLVREILFGKLYAKETFGVDVPVAWMSDGFGLNAQLPQIYRKSGYKWLAFRRGLPRSVGSRTSEFMWEGLDGSRILAHWMPLGYRAGLDLTQWEETYQKLDHLAATTNILMPCGSGGMLIQNEIPDSVRAWNARSDTPEMRIATPRQFFEAMSQNDEPPTVFKGELYSAELEDIFPDVVSSRISLKLAIRDCEDLIKSVEKAAALQYLRGHRYPTDRLTAAWKKMLFLSFHDVVPSCGIDEIYDEAWEYIADIRALAREFYASVVDTLPRDSDRGVGVMVLNPHSWEIRDWVEVDLKLGTGWSTEPGIYQDGVELVSEARDIVRWDDGTIQRVKLGFVAGAPAMGHRVYEVKPKSKAFRSTKIKVNGDGVSTKFFDLRVDQRGILEVNDKSGRPILRGNEVVLDAEVGDLYFHKSFLDQVLGFRERRRDPLRGVQAGGALDREGRGAFHHHLQERILLPALAVLPHRQVRAAAVPAEDARRHQARHRVQRHSADRFLHGAQSAATARPCATAVRYRHGRPVVHARDAVRRGGTAVRAHTRRRRQDAVADVDRRRGGRARTRVSDQGRPHQRSEGRRHFLHAVAQRVGALRRRRERSADSDARGPRTRPAFVPVFGIPVCRHVARGPHPARGLQFRRGAGRVSARPRPRRTGAHHLHARAREPGRVGVEEGRTRRGADFAFLRNGERPAGRNSRCHRKSNAFASSICWSATSTGRCRSTFRAIAYAWTSALSKS